MRGLTDREYELLRREREDHYRQVECDADDEVYFTLVALGRMRMEKCPDPRYNWRAWITPAGLEALSIHERILQLDLVG